MPSWQELEAKAGPLWDVAQARADGLTELDVEDRLNQRIADLHNKYGQYYDVQGAWGEGQRSLPQIMEGLRAVGERINTGSISEPKPQSLLQNALGGIKRVWQGADPSAPPVMDQGAISKLASGALMVPRAAGSLALGGMMAPAEALETAGGAAAEKAAELTSKVPAVNKILEKVPVPYPTDTKFGVPIGWEKGNLREVAPAALAAGGAMYADPMNWVFPAAGRAITAGKTAEVAKPQGRIMSWLSQKLEPEAGKYYNQLSPRGLAETAVGIADLGRGGVLALKRGANRLNAIPGLVEDAKEVLTGKQPSYLEDALATVKDKPASIMEMDETTRLRDLAETMGKDEAIKQETFNAENLLERRRKELMRQQGMKDAEIEQTLAAERATLAQVPKKAQEPLVAARSKAAEMLQSEDLETRDIGRMLNSTADALEQMEVITAKAEDVFPARVGKHGPEIGLPEESETLARVGGVKGAEPNTLWNSIKYPLVRFLGDPSSVLPKMAYEAGRVFDRFNRTKFSFYDAIRDGFNGLTPAQKQTVTIMLDTHPEKWEVLEKYGLRDAAVDAAYGKVRVVLDKLAQVEGLPKGLRIGDYFPHIGLKAGKKAIVLAEDAQAAFAVPAGSWLPRSSKETQGAIQKLISESSALGETFDPEHLLAIRVNAGLRKAYFNPMMSYWGPRLVNLSEGGKAYAQAYMNKLLGRPGKIWEGIDRFLSKVPWKGGTLSAAHMNKWQLAVTLNYYRGLLGLAMDTAFKNLTQAQNTVAELGFRNTAKGAARLFMETILTPEARKVFKNAGVIDDYEHIVAGSMDRINRSKAFKMFDAILFSPMKFSEYLNRGTAFHAGLIDAYKRGLTGPRAVEFAKKMVDKTQFRYGVTNTSPYLQNPFGKLWYQFSSYPMKEVEFINEILKDPDKKKLYRFLAFHGALLGADKLAGSNVAGAIGWEDVAVPLTGDADSGEGKVYVQVPTGILPHLGMYSAPAMKAGASVASAVGEVMDKGYPGPETTKAIDNATNLIPAKRYLAKLWEIQKKLNAGMDTKPPTTAQNIVSVMRGQGLKEYEPGGPKAEPYSGADAIQEALGVKLKKKKSIIPWFPLAGREELQ